MGVIVNPPLLMYIEVREASDIVDGKVISAVSFVTIFEFTTKFKVPMLTALTVAEVVVNEPFVIYPLVVDVIMLDKHCDIW